MYKNKLGSKLKYNEVLIRLKVEDKWTYTINGRTTTNPKFAFSNLDLLFHILVVNFINLLLI